LPGWVAGRLAVQLALETANFAVAALNFRKQIAITDLIKMGVIKMDVIKMAGICPFQYVIPFERTGGDLRQQSYHSLLHQPRAAEGPYAAQLSALHAAAQVSLLRPS
jgi:hypothetical protein